jgi:hypothetical protein
LLSLSQKRRFVSDSQRLAAFSDMMRCFCESKSPPATFVQASEVRVLLRALGRDVAGVVRRRDDVRLSDVAKFASLYDAADASPSTHVERRRVDELFKASAWARKLQHTQSRYLHVRTLLDLGALLPPNAGLDATVAAGNMRRYCTPHGASCSTIGRLPFGVSESFPQPRWIRSRREKWVDNFDVLCPERGTTDDFGSSVGGMGWSGRELGSEARVSDTTDDLGGWTRTSTESEPTAFTMPAAKTSPLY